MIRMISLIGGIALATAAYAETVPTVSQSKNYEDFSKKFCSADHNSQHIFILPVSVFSEQKSVKCKDGESTLRKSEPKDDPGHVVLNIDPPKGSKDGFDCDGKADLAMTLVAINCLPVSKETTAHPKK